jgi:membrane-associated phospholipid phosphatase
MQMRLRKLLLFVLSLCVAVFAGEAGFVVNALPAHPVEAASPKLADGNAVTDWNTIAIAAVLVDPGRIRDSRVLAMVQAAVHDAVNAIDRRYEPYTGNLWAPGASLDAAVAAASRDVLVTLSPTTASTTQQAYDSALSQIPDGPAKAAGLEIGHQSASATMNRRATDGLANASNPPYASTGEPGDYEATGFDAPTPPGVVGLFPGWGRVQPWGINLDEHKLPGPDPLDSLQYALDLNYLKGIGSVNSSWRTAEQTEIAHFWAEGAPAGWNRIANTVIRERKLDPWKAARILALVNFAIADSFIASFDAKYQFRFWRPSTSIRRADEDENPLTEPDPDWRPLFSAPPYLIPPIPDYPSNHAVVGAAAAEVLAHFFGDHTRFSTTSTSLVGVTRSFRGFTEAAVENGLSRAYAGIHFLRAIRDGYQQGSGIGHQIETLLPPADN